MYVIIEEHKIKYCYFTLEKVTRVHLEGGSYNIFMDIYNSSIFFNFRHENIFHIINRNIKKEQFITLIIQMQFFTYSVSVNAGVIINFLQCSYYAVLISSSSVKKRALVKEAYIYILYGL